MDSQYKKNAARLLAPIPLDPAHRGKFVSAVAGVLEQIDAGVDTTVLYTNAELPCEVRILAVAEGWAMVRRKGYIPFVVRLKELVHPAPVAGE